MAGNPQYATRDAPENDQPRNTETQSINDSREVDEERPLLGQSDETTPTMKPLTGVGTIIGVLLLGMAAYLEEIVIPLISFVKVNLFPMPMQPSSWPLPVSFPPNSIDFAMQVGFRLDIHWDFVLLNQWYVHLLDTRDVD